MLVIPANTPHIFLAAGFILALGVAEIQTTNAGEMLQGQRLASLNPNAISPRSGVNGARPDIEALRYYAVRGEQGRMQAELRRLKLLYPKWQQPKNIFSDQSSEEKTLWNFFSKSDISAVKTELARLKAVLPGFQPSPDLLTKIEDRETRESIKTAWKKKDWNGVLNLINHSPALLMGEDVELIWFVAEAYARLERPDAALEAFSAAFASSKTKQERKATMQKAAELLSTQAALTLLGSSPEVSLDTVLKGEVEDAIVRGALARSAEIGEQPPAILANHIAAFEKRALTNGIAQDAVLLAWSSFGRSQWRAAQNWFKVANDLGRNTKAMEGQILSLKHLGKLPVARQLAVQWKDETPEIGGLYLGLVAADLLATKPQALSVDFLQDFAAKTGSLKSGEGAEALGWYAYNVGQLDAARAWFAKAMQWELTETSVYGSALTASRQKDRVGFDALKASYGGKYQRIAKLKYKIRLSRSKIARLSRGSKLRTRKGRLRGKIAKVYKARQFGSCLRLSRKLRQLGPLQSSDQQLRGWCLLGAKRPAEAERAFAAAVRMGGKGKVASAYGQSLAALRTGQTNHALSVANANVLTAKQRRVVDIELLTQRSRAAFNNLDYAAAIFALNKRRKMTTESRDLTIMRAWAHHHVGQFKSSRQIFAMLDSQLSTRETRRGINANKRNITKLVQKDN